MVARPALTLYVGRGTAVLLRRVELDLLRARLDADALLHPAQRAPLARPGRGIYKLGSPPSGWGPTCRTDWSSLADLTWLRCCSRMRARVGAALAFARACMLLFLGPALAGHPVGVPDRLPRLARRRPGRAAADSTRRGDAGPRLLSSRWRRRARDPDPGRRGGWRSLSAPAAHAALAAASPSRSRCTGSGTRLRRRQGITPEQRPVDAGPSSPPRRSSARRRDVRPRGRLGTGRWRLVRGGGRLARADR